MPERVGEGLVLKVVKHGENGAVVTIFSKTDGLVKGYCRGAFSKKNAGVVQTGNLVFFRHFSRLDEQLGRLTCDLKTPFAAMAMADADALTLLSAVCGLLPLFPEREMMPDFYETTLAAIDVFFDAETRFETYARWELAFLSELGFGLDLSSCAVTGGTEDLVYVSPKTGRAVSRAAGEAWRDKLLILPPFLKDTGLRAKGGAEILDSLRLTGFFLEKFAFPHINGIFPVARSRLIERMTEK